MKDHKPIPANDNRRPITTHTPTTVPKAATPGLEQEIIELTPELAKMFYEERAKNRVINRSNVKRMAAAMKRGEWKLTHQGLAFNPSSKMTDGQHRCLAVIEAGVTVRILVTWNVPDDAMDVMDTGAVRKAHQTLQIDGVANANYIAAWANVARRTLGRKNDPFTTDELRQYIEENKEAVEWALSLPRKGLLRFGYLTGLLVLAYPMGHVQIAELAEKVESGVGLTANDPALGIRRLVTEGKTRRDGREVHLKILRCCMAAIKGEESFNPAKVFGTEASVAFFLEKYPVGCVVRRTG